MKLSEIKQSKRSTEKDFEIKNIKELKEKETINDIDESSILNEPPNANEIKESYSNNLLIFESNKSGNQLSHISENITFNNINKEINVTEFEKSQIETLGSFKDNNYKLQKI